MRELLLELAQGRNFVFHLGAEGAISGTGPFRIVEWQAGRRLTLATNEDYWGGRPFLDGIAIDLGVSARQQMTDFELGRADLVELEPPQVRRAIQGGRRVWSSAPVTLLALGFNLTGDSGRPAAFDARVREALALSIDRASITSVILQRQAEPVGSLLPQWLSGYAFLFETAANVEEARRILSEVSPPPSSLKLGYGVGDDLLRTVAERLALNARDAGLNVQAVPMSGSSNSLDLWLLRIRLPSIDPALALDEFASGLESWARALGDRASLPRPTTADPEQLYAAERGMLEGNRMIPIAYLPETVGLGARVRNWLPLRWGERRLADVWLDEPVQGAAQATPQNGPRQ
jgi:ABC-type transport system substrate-binding protein